MLNADEKSLNFNLMGSRNKSMTYDFVSTKSTYPDETIMSVWYFIVRINSNISSRIIFTALP